MPAAPTTFNTVANYGYVACSWSSVSGVDGYRLYRRPNGVGASFVLIYDTTDLSHDDWVPVYDLSDLNASPALVTYDYAVTSYDSGGESGLNSNTVAMNHITGTDITNASISHPPYNDGADKTASYTITNPDTVTPTVDDESKSMHEGRLRAITRYADEKKN